ncbi:MAG: type 1 glutamine amidotransferase [Pseudomonadota bacterium]
MRIGVLKTGNVNAALAPEHGEYPDMFAALLGAVDPALSFFTVDVVGGEMPGAVDAADGWIVTGSRHGAYDDLPWIAPLKEFLRAAVAARVPVIGVCFGHQVLAEALGGRVEKFDGGWALGVEAYESVASPGWMGALAEGWRGHAVHQDQVVALPPEATVLARSPFCAYAALAYGDPERPGAISVQPHPEFSADFVGGLIDARLGRIVEEDRVDAARATLGAPVDNAEWAAAMVRFLRAAQDAGAAHEA